MPDGLPKELLDWILPRVTDLQMENHERIYINPLKPEWRSILSRSQNYISAPVRWNAFAEYIRGIEGLLYSLGSHYFNARFQDKLTSFQEDELMNLRFYLDALLESRRSTSKRYLSEAAAMLLRRLQVVAGDLEIGDEDERWRLDSFEISDVP